MTDESLMRAYCEGDRKAFDLLFARLAPRIHGFFMRSFQNQSIADDLLQVTFMKLHRAKGTYQSDQALRPWLFTIAAHVRLDEWRKRKRSPELDSDGIDELEALSMTAHNDSTGASSGDPAVQMDDQRRRDVIRNAIAELPESQRVIIHLHRFEGLTFAQIARVLATTEGGVKLRAFRAYAQLRKKLQPLVQPSFHDGQKPLEVVT